MGDNRIHQLIVNQRERVVIVDALEAYCTKLKVDLATPMLTPMTGEIEARLAVVAGLLKTEFAKGPRYATSK